jgi:thiopeptide-type bacteriocin biosynthesis protein
MFSHVGYENNNDLLKLTMVGNTSATKLIGRFSSNNEEIAKICSEINDLEKKYNKNVIYAEIVHLPENRIGNISLRKDFRDYEIPYLAKSPKSNDYQILVDDLWVSIKRGKIILRSKKLNREIIPTLSNSHNYSYNGLPLYHFLSDLQNQNLKQSINLNWGSLHDQFKFIPRVKINNIIVTPSTWTLNKDDFSTILVDGKEVIKQVEEWKDKWRMPKYILLCNGDNKLLINLSNKLHLTMFVNEIRKKNRIKIEEFIFDKKKNIVSDNNKKIYTNQFVATLIKRDEKTIKNEFKLGKKKTESKIQRMFFVGSKWLYFKIYSGVKSSDSILVDFILPLVSSLKKNNFIDEWFFIRYGDPKHHLRIRFKIPDNQNIGNVINLLHKTLNPLLKSKIDWNITTDTYNREIERYGSNSIEISENLFHLNSDSVINAIKIFNKTKNENHRWWFALQMIDSMLNLASYDLVQKEDFIKKLKIGFTNEHGGGKNLSKQLSDRFRLVRENTDNILNYSINNRDFLPLMRVIQYHTNNAEKYITQILLLKEEKKLEVELEDLLSSYFHMFVNRLFSSKQRTHEMVIYDYIWRFYHSSLARQRKNKMLL